MKADTQEWVRYAEEDYAVVSILIRRRKNPVFNTVGFHCQQCVEKYLKARAIEAGQPVIKTHDLVTLLKKLLPVEPLWSAFLSTAKHLTSYARRVPLPRPCGDQAGRSGGLARLSRHPQGSPGEPGAARALSF